MYVCCVWWHAIHGNPYLHSAGCPALWDIRPLPRSALEGAELTEQSAVLLAPQDMEEEDHQTQKKGAVPGKYCRL